MNGKAMEIIISPDGTQVYAAAGEVATPAIETTIYFDDRQLASPHTLTNLSVIERGNSAATMAENYMPPQPDLVEPRPRHAYIKNSVAGALALVVTALPSVLLPAAVEAQPEPISGDAVEGAPADYHQTTGTREFNNPENSCAQPSAEQSPFNQDHVQRLDGLLNRLGTIDNSSKVLEFFYQLGEGVYDIPFRFYQGPPRTDFHPNFEVSGSDLRNTDYRSLDNLLRHFISELDNLPPGFLQAAQINEVVFVESIRNIASPENAINSLGGLYLFEGKIFITLNALSRQTFTHEFTHALDTALCSDPSDYYHDPDISNYNTIPYVGTGEYFDDGQVMVSPRYHMPGPHREFANIYAMTNVAEDRAEIIGEILRRGLIRPGDPDYESPFYHKMMAMVRRWESVSPGITAHYLEPLTDSLRAQEGFGGLYLNTYQEWLGNQHDQFFQIFELAAANLGPARIDLRAEKSLLRLGYEANHYESVIIIQPGFGAGGLGLVVANAGLAWGEAGPPTDAKGNIQPETITYTVMVDGRPRLVTQRFDPNGMDVMHFPTTQSTRSGIQGFSTNIPAPPAYDAFSGRFDYRINATNGPYGAAVSSSDLGMSQRLLQEIMNFDLVEASHNGDGGIPFEFTDPSSSSTHTTTQ